MERESRFDLTGQLAGLVSASESEIAETPFDYGMSWGATPLILSRNERPEVAGRQLKVYDALLDRIIANTPAETPVELSRFVQETFMSRFHERAVQNMGSFQERLTQDLTTIPPEAYEICERAFNGFATPAELIAVRNILGMKSIELARITYAYEAEVADVDEMYSHVKTGIIANGGVVYDTPELTQARYKLRRNDFYQGGDVETHEHQGLLLTYKQTTGVMPDDTHVMERASYILRLDEGGQLDPMFTAKLRQLSLDEIYMHMELPVEHVDHIPLIKLITELIADNNFTALIPISSTVYAYNRTTEGQIKAQKKVVREAERGESDTLRQFIADVPNN